MTFSINSKIRKQLDTKGYYHLAYGTKAGWENQPEQDDIILDYIEKMQRLYKKYKTRKFRELTDILPEKIGKTLDKAWHDRMNRRVVLKIANSYYPTAKYIQVSLERLGLYHLYKELTEIYPSKNFTIQADYPDQSDTPTHLMIPDRIGQCAFCAEDDKVLWIIHNDVGIGVCKKCLFKEHRREITYGNGRKIDFKKEKELDKKQDNRERYLNGEFWFNTKKGIWVRD